MAVFQATLERSGASSSVPPSTPGSYHVGETYGGDNRLQRQLQMPVFDGSDPGGWISRAERYFSVNCLSQAEKIEAAAVSFDREAMAWFQSEDRRRPLRSWDELKALLLDRFGSSQKGTNYEKLLALKPIGTVRDYRHESETMAASETVAASLFDVPDNALEGAVVNGLKPCIWMQPNGPARVLEVAQRIEDHNQALKQDKLGTIFNSGTLRSPIQELKGPSPSTPAILSPVNSQAKQTLEHPCKRFIYAELLRKRDRGLYYPWDERFSPGHRCKFKEFQVLVVQEEEEFLPEKKDSHGVDSGKILAYQRVMELDVIVLNLARDYFAFTQDTYLKPDKVPMQPIPVSMEHLAGTDWALVTTNDDKKYYYNSKTNVSSWQVPCEVTELRKSDDGISKENSMSMPNSNIVIEKVYAPTSLSAPALSTGGRDAEEKAQAIRAATVSSFKSMLREKGDITVSFHWSKVRDSLRNDPRYRSIKHEDREFIFNEYGCELKAAKDEEEGESKARREEQENFETTWKHSDIIKAKVQFLAQPSHDDGAKHPTNEASLGLLRSKKSSLALWQGAGHYTTILEWLNSFGMLTLEWLKSSGMLWKQLSNSVSAISKLQVPERENMTEMEALRNYGRTHGNIDLDDYAEELMVDLELSKTVANKVPTPPPLVMMEKLMEERETILDELKQNLKEAQDDMKGYFMDSTEKEARECYNEVVRENSSMKLSAVAYDSVLDALFNNGKFMMKALSEVGRLDEMLKIVDIILDDDGTETDEELQEFMKGEVGKEGQEEDLVKLMEEKEGQKTALMAKETEAKSAN